MFHANPSEQLNTVHDQLRATNAEIPLVQFEACYYNITDTHKYNWHVGIADVPNDDNDFTFICHSFVTCVCIFARHKLHSLNFWCVRACVLLPTGPAHPTRSDE